MKNINVPITKHDAGKAIKKLRLKKATGPDRFTIEFFSLFLKNT